MQFAVEIMLDAILKSTQIKIRICISGYVKVFT